MSNEERNPITMLVEMSLVFAIDSKYLTEILSTRGVPTKRGRFEAQEIIQGTLLFIRALLLSLPQDAENPLGDVQVTNPPSPSWDGWNISPSAAVTVDGEPVEQADQVADWKRRHPDSWAFGIQINLPPQRADEVLYLRTWFQKIESLLTCPTEIPIDGLSSLDRQFCAWVNPSCDVKVSAHFRSLGVCQNITSLWSFFENDIARFYPDISGQPGARVFDSVVPTGLTPPQFRDQVYRTKCRWDLWNLLYDGAEQDLRSVKLDFSRKGYLNLAPFARMSVKFKERPGALKQVSMYSWLMLSLRIVELARDTCSWECLTDVVGTDYNVGDLHDVLRLYDDPEIRWDH